MYCIYNYCGEAPQITKLHLWTEDLNFGDLDNNNNQLRPHIVWFGEKSLQLKKQY
jgi:NAD-dependent SIR2 family protein deacetylase